MYRNRNLVRSKAVRVSINNYEVHALRVIEEEEDMVPGTFYYVLGSPGTPAKEVSRLRKRYIELISHFRGVLDENKVA